MAQQAELLLILPIRKPRKSSKLQQGAVKGRRTRKSKLLRLKSLSQKLSSGIVSSTWLSNKSALSGIISIVRLFKRSKKKATRARSEEKRQGQTKVSIEVSTTHWIPLAILQASKDGTLRRQTKSHRPSLRLPQQLVNGLSNLLKE